MNDLAPTNAASAGEHNRIQPDQMYWAGESYVSGTVIIRLLHTVPSDQPARADHSVRPTKQRGPAEFREDDLQILAEACRYLNVSRTTFNKQYRALLAPYQRRKGRRDAWPTGVLDLLRKGEPIPHPEELPKVPDRRKNAGRFTHLI